MSPPADDKTSLKGVRPGSREQFQNFTPHQVSLERLKLETWNLVCGLATSCRPANLQMTHYPTSGRGQIPWRILEFYTHEISLEWLKSSHFVHGEVSALIVTTKCPQGAWSVSRDVLNVWQISVNIRTVQDSDILRSNNRRLIGSYMACRIALTAVILNDLDGHSPVAGLSKCNSFAICAEFYNPMTQCIARFVGYSWASCSSHNRISSSTSCERLITSDLIIWHQRE